MYSVFYTLLLNLNSLSLEPVVVATPEHFRKMCHCQLFCQPLCFLCVAGQKGTAYTLVTPKDKEFAGHLVRNLEGANQFVPPELIDLAMQASTNTTSQLGGVCDK